MDMDMDDGGEAMIDEDLNDSFEDDEEMNGGNSSFQTRNLRSSSGHGIPNGYHHSSAGHHQQQQQQLSSMEDESTRFVVINDPKNPAPFNTCSCSSKPIMASVHDAHSVSSSNKTVFCQAIDCFDGKMVGCCNETKLTNLLFRASKRVPYRVYCEVHLARLRRHHCCPGCGIYCTQGEFLQCNSVKKQVHLFHKSCQIVTQHLPPGKQHCPHCGNISEERSFTITMNGSLNSSTVYYLWQSSTPPSNPLQSSPLRQVSQAAVTQEPALGPRARMAATSKNLSEDHVEENGEEKEDEETAVSLPVKGSKKALSTSGLSFGPAKDELQSMLQCILKEGHSVEGQPEESFYLLAKEGSLEKVILLLSQGFDPNFKFEDHEDDTALHVAAASGHLSVVHILIQAGGNVNVINGRLSTPLMEAVENHRIEVIDHLIKMGASLDFRGEDGMTALHIASKLGNYEAVKKILDTRKIDVNLQDDGGWTPLIWATEHKQKQVVQLLLSKGADPNVQDDEENVCLHWAAFSGDVDIVSIFLDLTLDINAVNVHGDTALHIACRRDNHETVLLLTSKDNIDVSVVNKNKETPLMCCPKNSSSFTALSIKCQLNGIRVAKKEAGLPATSERYLHRDISKGKERNPIPIVNGVDDESPPTGDFIYISTNCETSRLNIDRTVTSLQSCKCVNDCTTEECICGTISFRCWYDNEGKLVDSFNFSDPPMIFECNRVCSCWNNCNNRIVQRGIQCRLQVFKTTVGKKGWGVRTLKFIPKGSFVIEYIGEVIPDAEADRREDDSYLFDLDHRDGDSLHCIDARFYGNAARFINHGCQANLTPVKVFVDHQDLSFPRMALFANRDIFPNEELTFDYGEKFWVIKSRLFTCECGSRNCLYSKDNINQTLATYYQATSSSSSNGRRAPIP